MIEKNLAKKQIKQLEAALPALASLQEIYEHDKKVQAALKIVVAKLAFERGYWHYVLSDSNTKGPVLI